MAYQFQYGVDTLSIQTALDLANGKCKGVLSKQAKQKMQACFDAVQTMAQGEAPIYSINTGFGSLCTTRISEENTGTLQENLLKSHSVGVGNPIDAAIAKLMLILKVHALAVGHSGISMQVVERILWHIENDVTPHVPEKGSVGASGDLAPLSHLFLPLIGEGKVTLNGGKSYVSTKSVLKKNGLSAIKLGPKEGLALINGTQFIAAHAVHVAHRLERCLDYANLVGGLSLEALMGSHRPFASKLHKLRPHSGAVHVAKQLSRILKGSEIVKSHKSCGRVQDPYSLRCMPQVHGASRDAFIHFQEVLTCEINSVTDNPIIFSETEAISGGNFHGQPLALPLDYATLAASELGSISDRRSYLLLEGIAGLPIYLMKESGLNSGFMIAQYCSAALASENKSLCFPASADSIPTSMGQEDHVSMGSIGSRKALSVVQNLEKILAIELFCAAQALDFRRPLKSSATMEAFHKAIRKKIPHLKKDGVMSDHIDVAVSMIQDSALLESLLTSSKSS